MTNIMACSNAADSDPVEKRNDLERECLLGSRIFGWENLCKRIFWQMEELASGKSGSSLFVFLTFYCVTADGKMQFFFLIVSVFLMK